MGYIEHSGSFRPQKFEETHTKFSLHVKFCLEAVHSKEHLRPVFGNGWFVLELCKLPVEQGNSSPALDISAPGLFTYFFPPSCDVTHTNRWLKMTILEFCPQYVAGTSTTPVSALTISELPSDAHLDLRKLSVDPFLKSGLQ